MNMFTLTGHSLFVKRAVPTAPTSHQGSHWLLSGVENDEFYSNPDVLHSLTSAIKTVLDTPDETMADNASAERNATLAAAEASVVSAWPTTPGFIVARGEHLEHADSGSRYFLLGGDYFRSAFSNTLTPDTLTADLVNAVGAGLNTVRVYGLGSPGEDNKAVFRRFYAKHGLRVLYTMSACVASCPLFIMPLRE
jgi:hypothetical protein